MIYLFIFLDLPVRSPSFHHLLHCMAGKQDASDLNMPETDKIGDYQLDYYNNTARCQVNSCRVKCTYPEPKVNRFLKNLEKYTMKDVKLIDGRLTAETSTSVKALVNILIGNAEFKNLLMALGSLSLIPKLSLAPSPTNTL